MQPCRQTLAAFDNTQYKLLRIVSSGPPSVSKRQQMKRCSRISTPEYCALRLVANLRTTSTGLRSQFWPTSVVQGYDHLRLRGSGFGAVHQHLLYT